VRRWMVEAGSVALALALAVIVWASAEREGNPVFVMRGVPAEVRGIGSGLALSRTSAETVDVQGRAPEQFWDTGSEADFDVYVDVSGLGPGEHVVEVQVESLRKEAFVAGVVPSQITIDLARLVGKTVPVRAEVMDSAGVGYDWRTPEVMPAEVRVTGLEQYVEAAVVAVAPTYLRSARSTVERKVAVSVRDSSDQPLGGVVEYDPRMVTVTVPIEQRTGYRDLPVRARWEGQPAEGYRISQVTVDPSTVTVFGGPSAVQGIPGYVETAPVAIEGAVADVIERVSLVVPEDALVLGVQNVVVSVSITPVEQSTWVEVAPVVRGLDAQMEVELAPLVVQILVAGPLPRLEALVPADVRATLDLTGLSVGAYSLTPTVLLPEGVRQQAIVPEIVEVRIFARDATGGAGGVNSSSPVTPVGGSGPEVTPSELATPTTVATTTSFDG
jgi:YbbR domain-containing protein